MCKWRIIIGSKKKKKAALIDPETEKRPVIARGRGKRTWGTANRGACFV